MKICAVVKYPPIQGGVSALSYRIAMDLAAAGHQVSVITNADEVEDDYRISMGPEDRERLTARFPGGGSVTLVATNPLGRKMAEHIPHSKPFVTKLAALATEEIRRIGADVVFSYYLEPYGLAAHLAARWTGVPHVVQHAGSDRTRLLAHPDLSTAYREVLRGADAVLAQPGSVEGFGVSAARVFPLPRRALPAGFAGLDPRPLDVDAVIARAAASGDPWMTNTAPVPTDRVTLGVYGKLGEIKGSYDLVAALRRVAETGREFSLLVMGGGHQRPRFARAVADAGLAGRTWTLPFLPHWRVPEFLARLDAACFLERRFPVHIHTPGIPQEIMSSGTCLVVSREIADKQPVHARMRHGENVFVVEEPSDAAELAGILARIVDDPEAARAAGRAGRDLYPDPEPGALAAAYADIFARAVTPEIRDAPPTWRVLLRRHLPATLAALGDAAEPVLTEAAAGSYVTEPARAYGAVEALVKWAEAEGDALPEAVRAAAAFERDLCWMNLDLESPSGAALFPRREPASLILSDPIDLRRRRPVLAAHTRTRQHRDDIEALLSALREGRPYDRPAERSATFLFVKRGDLYGIALRLGEATEKLLRLCDGTHEAGEIIERLKGGTDCGPGSGPDGGAAGVERMLVKLAYDRVILL